MSLKSFLRIVQLYNEDLIIPTELLQFVNQFLNRSPELLFWFHQKFVRREVTSAKAPEEVTTRAKCKEVKLDYKSCKRVGVNYRVMPSNSLPAKCSGRTPLCDEVLNDTHFTCPYWLEKQRKNWVPGDLNLAFKVHSPEGEHYRVDEERYEVDMILESNSSLILTLERLTKRMERMTPAQLDSFELEETLLGGGSKVHFQKAIHRLYGDERIGRDVVQALTKNPVTTIPILLRRLREKDEEWQEARIKMIQIWRDDVEDAYEKHRQALELAEKRGKCKRRQPLLGTTDSD